MIRRMREKAREQSSKIYDNPLISQVNRLFVNGMGQYVLAILAMLPLLAVCAVILTLFGQQPDSIIRAFTETSDWILSKEISPPPVAYDTHYLSLYLVETNPEDKITSQYLPVIKSL